ncbi:zinc-binding phosphatase [Trypanosoma rangeli]|uniref:Zinc-binding phosphatase n=1 Tax=Trypanosoma rangeli TaxID=5698 RepID=A0A422NTJ8_TRYRA|nr:zinc-binding phosphatase [Trypanosoma rangeli]RNF08793.1 zinc-binding phosphatase [Trypanosoma rangeli]|eukprot:RNF08793.1 zinc-binding phosphatase [Trypanosoma rangeli]
MSRGTLSDHLIGEKSFIDIRHNAIEGEAAALLYPADDDRQPLRCALTISNYRVVIRPEGGDRVAEALGFSLPLLSIASWSVQRKPMSALPRAVFQWGWGQAATDHDTATCSPDEKTPPPLAQSNFPSAGYTLRIVSKHLWEVEVLLQGERLATTVRGLWQKLNAPQLRSMPAFVLYRNRHFARYENVAADDVENTEETRRAEERGDGSRSIDRVCEGGGVVEDGVENLMDSIEFGWNLYDAERELERQLSLLPGTAVPSPSDTSRAGTMRDLRPWFRLTCVKQPSNGYGKSPTYPFRVVVPNAASDELLETAMTTRSRARFPVVSFVHLGSGAVLARASQPLMRSPALLQDGELCRMFTNSGYHAHNAEPRSEVSVSVSVAPLSSRPMPPPSLFDTSLDEPQAMRLPPGVQKDTTAAATRSQRTLFVFDCRPSNAAHANLAMGGGYEGGATHDFCEVKFHGIENIHNVSKSFAKLKTLIHRYNGKQAREDFLLQLDGTRWLDYVQRVLICSNKIAESLDLGNSCLVHCTDGWDRTPQCTATAMLLLDPFYRTIIGFCVLVEKEFCSFGHKFAERCDHQVLGETSYASDAGVTGSDTDAQQSAAKLQPSPIFVQWMDVVFQVVRQFPRQFEFTTRLLEYLSEEVYACLYGTFLCNGEKERMFEGVRLGTASIWTHVVRAAARERAGKSPLYFVNDAYDSATAWQYISKKRGSGIQRLSPNCSSKRLVFWESFYLRHDGDNCSIELCDGTQKVTKKLMFHKAWEEYFDEFLRDSCVERREEVSDMRRRLQNLCVGRSTATAASTASGKGNSKMCSQCHKTLGFFSLREQCVRCGSTLCSSCANSGPGSFKLCLDCYKLCEWDSQ